MDPELSDRLAELLRDPAWPDSVRGMSETLHAAQTSAGPLAPWLAERAARQRRFGARFVADRTSGRTPSPDEPATRARLEQYALGVAALHAVREVDVEEGHRWRLGGTDHCPDCVALAASGVFAPGTLPTAPGMGETVCRHNCNCELVPVIGAPEARPAFAALIAGAAFARSDAELLEVGDLELKLAHARRSFEQTGDPTWERRAREAERGLAARPLPGRWIVAAAAVTLARQDRDQLGAAVPISAIDAAELGRDLDQFGAPAPTVSPPDTATWEQVVARPQARHVVGAGLAETVALLSAAVSALGSSPTARLFLPARALLVRAGFLLFGASEELDRVAPTSQLGVSGVVIP